MAQFPFFIKLEVTLTASGTASLSHQANNQETITLNSMMIRSTGAFGITDIRDSDGINYTNASQSNDIASEMLPDGANGNNNIGSFPIPLVLKPGRTLYFDLLDTSAAGNTVELLLIGSKNTG